MPRPTLDDLAGQTFDVAVIGAGIVGSSAARRLAQAGYRVLVVDRADFASGATARSSRFLPNGLRYLSLGGSLRGLLSQPRELLPALKMARQAMRARSRFVRRSPHYVRSMNFAYPLYEGGPYNAGQLSLAFGLLRLLDPLGEPLDYRRLSRDAVLETPLLRWLASPERLRGAAVFREYQIDWPERVALDALMDAQRAGAVLRNYTPVAGLERDEGALWQVWLVEGSSRVSVQARVVLNAAGPWVDLVNQSAAVEASQLVGWTKGAHILVELPQECRPWGLAAIAADGRPISITPWRKGHFIGPTETPYHGDPDDVRITGEDVDWLLEQAARLIPGAGLRRESMIGGWAGIRPLSWSATAAAPRRDCVLHDLAEHGLPGVLAVTGAPLSTHELTAARVLAAVERLVRRNPHAEPLGLRPAQPPATQPPATPTSLTRENVERFVLQEQARKVEDLLLRRTGLGWNAGMAADLAQPAAAMMGDLLGWDADRVEEEAQVYLLELQRTYGLASKLAG